MNRRRFLAFLGLAPAVAVLPTRGAPAPVTYGVRGVISQTGVFGFVGRRASDGLVEHRLWFAEQVRKLDDKFNAAEAASLPNEACSPCAPSRPEPRQIDLHPRISADDRGDP